MSGVRTGTRLDQLEHLARRITHQHDAAQRRGDRTEAQRLTELAAAVDVEIAAEHAARAAAARQRPTVATGVRRADDTATRHLTALGVTAHDVKAWAVEQGLIGEVKRGRVSGRLVDAYEHAHRTQEQEPA